MIHQPAVVSFGFDKCACSFMIRPIMEKRTIPVRTIFGTFESLFESNAPEKGYTVTVPRLKGIVTCGDTLPEAKRMAKEAIELHCECLIEDGEAELKVHHPQRGKEMVRA